MLIIFQSMLWMLLGIIVYRERVVNADTPKFLGRALYWLGVPLQIFFLARRSNFEQIAWLPPIVTVSVLLLGLILALLVLRLFKQLCHRDRFKLLFPSYETSRRKTMPIFKSASFETGLFRLIEYRFNKQDRDRDTAVKEISTIDELKSLLAELQTSTAKPSLPPAKSAIERFSLPKTRNGTGSFILASILCNTGFIDLILIPPLVDFQYWSWIILYGVAHNIIGNYGLGVLIAARYSYPERRNNWSNQLQSLLLSPSIWAFIYGYISRDLSFPYAIEAAISKVVLLVIPGAFILIGMELSTLQQWQNLRSGIFPAIFKMIILPGLAGLLFTLMGMEGDSRLVLILMCSMPTAFASLILAEEYNLDRQVAANSILLSTLFLPIAILLWVAIF